MTTLTETTRNLQGCRIETSVDRVKKETRFSLTSICGKYYTVFDNEEKKSIEFVGKRAFDKFANSNEYMTDF